MSRAGRRPVAGNAAPDFDVSTLTSVDLFRVVARIGQGKATLPPGVSIAELQELAAEKARQEHPAQPWQANPSDDGASLGAESADSGTSSTTRHSVSGSWIPTSGDRGMGRRLQI